MLKRLKISQIEKKDWKEELSEYLIMYRTTPHSTTGISPAELLFKRKIRTRLPEIDYYDYDDLEVRDRDKESKQKSKIYTDEKRRARETIKEGDRVLLRQERENKLTPMFKSQPYEVKSKVGNSVIVKSPGGRGGSRKNSDILTTTPIVPRSKIYDYIYTYKNTNTKET